MSIIRGHNVWSLCPLYYTKFIQFVLKTYKAINRIAPDFKSNTNKKMCLLVVAIVSMCQFVAIVTM